MSSVPRTDQMCAETIVLWFIYTISVFSFVKTIYYTLGVECQFLFWRKTRTIYVCTYTIQIVNQHWYQFHCDLIHHLKLNICTHLSLDSYIKKQFFFVWTQWLDKATATFQGVSLNYTVHSLNSLGTMFYGLAHYWHESWTMLLCSWCACWLMHKSDLCIDYINFALVNQGFVFFPCLHTVSEIVVILIKSLTLQISVSYFAEIASDYKYANCSQHKMKLLWHCCWLLIYY